jgi:hypothetical protein
VRKRERKKKRERERERKREEKRGEGVETFSGERVSPGHISNATKLP